MVRTRDDVAGLGTILSVWAHPDDETYLAGGLMAAARQHGQRVVCAAASAGEHGTPDPTTWPPERLGRIRRWEAAAAMAVLGVDEHEVRGLPDGGLARCGVEGRAWVRRLLDVVEPDTVVTFGRDGMTFHPDHIAVHRWVTDAWRAAGRRARLLYAARTVEHVERFDALYDRLGVYMTDERLTGVPVAELAVRLSLDDDLLDRKLTALRALATQTTDLAVAVGPGTYAELAREECFVEA